MLQVLSKSGYFLTSLETFQKCCSKQSLETEIFVGKNLAVNVDKHFSVMDVFVTQVVFKMTAFGY